MRRALPSYFTWQAKVTNPTIRACPTHELAVVGSGLAGTGWHWNHDPLLPNSTQVKSLNLIILEHLYWLWKSNTFTVCKFEFCIWAGIFLKDTTVWQFSFSCTIFEWYFWTPEQISFLFCSLIITWRFGQFSLKLFIFLGKWNEGVFLFSYTHKTCYLSWR